MKIEYISYERKKELVISSENEKEKIFLEEFRDMLENTNEKIECKYIPKLNFMSISTFEWW